MEDSIGDKHKRKANNQKKRLSEEHKKTQSELDTQLQHQKELIKRYGADLERYEE